jgi:hypothetical protein
MKHIITLILAMLALCSTAQATEFDCAPTSVVGTGFQFGVRAGDWEYAYSYTDFQSSDNTTAGQGQYWYCRVGAPPVKPADFVPPAGWVAATVGATGIVSRGSSYLIVESWHATPAQAAKMPTNIIAQVWTHGALRIEQVLPYQCYQLAQLGWYPSAAEKRLCEGLLRQAVATAPQ